MATEPLEPKYTNADLVNEIIGAVAAVQDAHATLVEGARELRAVKAQITDVPAPSKIVLSGADGKLDAGWFPEDMVGGSQWLFAVCDTAGSIACKSFTLNKFRLVPGVRLAVMFSYVNSVENPTLSINGETALPVLWQGANLSAGTLLADRVYELIYTGSAWQVLSGMGPWDFHPLRAPLAVQNVKFSGRNPIMPGETTARTNWLLCDGGSDGLGGNVPDLRGRFLLGSDASYAAGSTGGSANHTHSLSGSVGETTLSGSQLGSHWHYLCRASSSPIKDGFQTGINGNTYRNYPIADYGGAGEHLYSLAAAHDGATESADRAKSSLPNGAASSSSHTHALSGSTGAGDLPPYYALAYLIRIR